MGKVAAAQSNTKTVKTESIFALSFRGGLPEILRAIADKLDQGEVIADSFTSAVTKDHFELRVVIDLQK